MPIFPIFFAPRHVTRSAGIRRALLGAGPLALLLIVPSYGVGQTADRMTNGAESNFIAAEPAEWSGGPGVSSSVAGLPDAPNAQARQESGVAGRGLNLSILAMAPDRSVAAQTPASATDKYILPGQQAPSITAGNKFVLGVKDAVSPLSAVGWILSAGYEQGTNGSPNYGTNREAFAKRFGAAAARATSEGIFSDSIMAPLLHEDPRYYQLGPGHSFARRIGYAVTRTLVTRTDSGRATPNLALLAGNLGGAYLTNVYYPPLNQGFSQTMQTFGGSVGGSALGFAVSEFFSNTLQFLHISDNK